MKKILKNCSSSHALGFMLIPDVIYAQVGRVHRATRRRTAVVVGKLRPRLRARASSRGPAAAAATSRSCRRRTAGCRRRAGGCRRRAGGCRREAGAAVAQGLLPLGTVVRTLPEGCVTTAVGG